MRKYKYILFDLDGTLIYSHPGIFACFRRVLKEFGKPEPTDEELLPAVGPPISLSFVQYYGLTEEETARAVKRYRALYAEIGTMQNDPIEGALSALRALHEGGYVLGLATSKPAPFAEKIVARHGFAPYLAQTVGCGLDGSLPTKADVIAEALRRLGASPKECLMVGDRKYDVEGADAFGMDCALLKIGGYATEEELYSCGATYVLKDFEGLKNLLLL